MNRKHIYYCLLLAIIVTGLHNIFVPYTSFPVEQSLNVGQITEKDIIAPFDFPILKSKQQLESEREIIAKSLKPVYRIEDEIQFKTIKLLNELFFPLIEAKIKKDTLSISNHFKSLNVGLSPKTINYLSKSDNLKILYNTLNNEVNRIYKKGVCSETDNDTINIIIDGEVKIINKDQLFNKHDAIKNTTGKYKNPIQKPVYEEFLNALIEPNLVPDQNRFNELVDNTLSLLPKTIGNVTKNEIIVRSNSRITEQDQVKIQSLISASRKTDNTNYTWKTLSHNISIFLYYFVLGMMLVIFYRIFYADLLNKKYHFLPLITGLSLNAVFAILNNQILGLQTLLIPYSMTVVASAILINIPFALFYNFLSFASIIPFVNWETFSPLVLVLATSFALLMMKRMGDKHQYFAIWINLLISTIALSIVFSLYKFESAITIFENIGYAIIASTMSMILVVFIVPFLERKWKLASKQQLLELLDFNHPLLKKLATEAAGTYYHSLVVGNLSERAAEAIGANSLLARVGSYYHDIGKINNPNSFTENNPESAEMHENLDPSESAAVIKKHVSDGIRLADRHKIPDIVKNIILQHHGTGYIKYFLDKAEKSNLDIDLEKYKYDGPKPKSKEAALVMIADIVESIAKSWEKINSDDIRNILKDTLFRLIKEGQFDEAPITVSELNEAKESMIPILESIYRKRQQYPEHLNDE